MEPLPAEPTVPDRIDLAMIKPVHNRASVALSADRAAGLSVKLELTATGLVAVDGMVSAIVLATTILVGVAIRDSRRAHSA